MQYFFNVPDDFVKAIEWHGYRYQLSDFLEKHISENDGNEYILEMEEYEAWEFKEILEDEGALSCGSGELNQWIYSIADQII